MDVLKIEEMVKGWFVGDFEPSAFRTKDVEVSWRVHPAGEQWDHHYHKVATEINLLISGSMTMCGEDLKAGDIFVVHPMEVADPVFHEDCSVVCVKVPSVPGDKYVVDS